MGIGTRLQVLLEQSNCTPIQLAKAVGAPEQTIYSLLKRDSKKVSVDVLLSICEYFGVDVSYFSEEYRGFEAPVPLSPAETRIGRLYGLADDHARDIVDVTLKPYESEFAPPRPAPLEDTTEIKVAARDGAGFDEVTDVEQRQAMNRVIEKSRKRPNPRIP